MFVMPFSFVMALTLGVSGDTIWSVFWVAPVLIVWAAHAWLGEPAPPRVWVFAGLGALATMLLYSLSRPVPAWLLVLPVIMSLSFSLYVVMTRNLRHEPVLANLFYTALGVFLVLTPIMPRIWVQPSPHDAMVMAGIGLLGLVTLFALDRATAAAPVAATAPVCYLYAVCVSAARTFLHGGMPSRRELVGSALIVGIVVFLWSHASRNPETSPVLSENPAR
jgi:hypothetical protein